MKPLELINTLLANQAETIGQQWIALVSSKWQAQYPNVLSEHELKTQSLKLLDELKRLLSLHADKNTLDIPLSDELVKMLRHLSINRAKLGFKVADTAFYILCLKTIITQNLRLNVDGDFALLADCLTAIDNLIDRLSILIFDASIEIREEIITQQSLSIQELSTPVIRLWDQILLLPLVGVIDTFRARQFTENLLVAISRYEATVTVIDVTGVPVFDTSVARHIMKTVDAAQLLGTRIIMTGISPEGALTLTKLGLNFSSTLCRSTLKAGVAEALQMIGKRIISKEAAK